MDRVRKMQPIRDGVLHGYPSMYEVETGKIVFLNLDIDKAQTLHEHGETVVTMADLVGAGQICHQLAADFGDFGHKLFDAGVARDKS